MNKTLCSVVTLAPLLLPCWATAQPGKISSDTIAEVNKPYSLSFTLRTPPVNTGCGLRIDWGDGVVETFSVGPGRKLPPPYSPVNHTYGTPGKFKVRIQGESIMFPPAPQMPPMPSSPCAIFDELTITVSAADGGAAAQSTGASSSTLYQALNPKYSAPNLLLQWDHTWGKRDQFGDSRRTLFTCTSQDDRERTVLQGNEMSWRSADSPSANQACNVWASFTENLITGVELRVLSADPDGRNQIKITAKDKNGTDIDALILNMGQFGFAGWYEARNRGSFSQGTFVAPLENKPSTGVFEYVGDITIDRSNRVSIERISVDFSMNTISVLGRVRVTGNLGTVRTINPIQFNPQTGRFKGALEYSLNMPQGISQNRIQISGAIGGNGGKLIAATMHTGAEPAFVPGTGGRTRKGFDLMLLQQE